jgi:hypothetical protein
MNSIGAEQPDHDHRQVQAHGGAEHVSAIDVCNRHAKQERQACGGLQPVTEGDGAKFLSGTLQVAVAGEAGAPQLRLASADGTTLTLGGTPTPETRFGGPGARAFLEVSPEPCVAPAPATPPCLMVRDRHFDENGLASGVPGEWRALPEGIEGYAPVAGEQHVVRVKRFEQAGTEHFVLDLIIETRTLQ